MPQGLATLPLWAKSSQRGINHSTIKWCKWGRRPAWWFRDHNPDPTLVDIPKSATSTFTRWDMLYRKNLLFLRDTNGCGWLQLTTSLIVLFYQSIRAMFKPRECWAALRKPSPLQQNSALVPVALASGIFSGCLTRQLAVIIEYDRQPYIYICM